MTHDDQDWLRRSLSVLTPPDAGWPSVGDIRRRARARRRRQRGAGVIAAAVVVALAVIIPLRATSPGTARPRAAAHAGTAVQLTSGAAPLRLTGDARVKNAVARSEEQFSLALLRQLAARAPASANLVISPSSLATALAMLELGARGPTQRQIANALRSSSLAAAKQAAGWAALRADLAQAGARDNVAVQSADSLWLQRGLPMAPGFMTALSQYFATGVWQVDFARHPAAAVRALDAWVSAQTHGRIRSIFAPGVINPATALILANAVYFKAAWQEPFWRTTKPGTFTLSSGATVTVPFMHSGPGPEGALPVTASASPGLDAVQLPYAGGRFAALVLMPPAGTLAGFVRTLSLARLDAIVSGLRAANVDLAMPRFRVEDSHDLNPALQALGIKLAFTPAADLSGMSPTPLSVADVAQKAFLKVTQWGTEAAAATGLVIAAAGHQAQMWITIDHPFLFLIRDTKTGAILFASQVGNPAAS